MINQYTGITEYYDLWTTTGYYDYNSVAKDAYSIVGDVNQVLELGVGTGLLAEQYIEINPKCDFTGIDFSPSMLEIAKKRLVNRVNLMELDAVTMNLNKKFDVAISNGGVWLFVQMGDQWKLSSHIRDIEANHQGLENVYHHLKEDGLFLLSRQKSHGDFKQDLPNDIVYSQSFEEGIDTEDYHTRIKRYFFKKDGEILAQDQLMLTLFKPKAIERMFSKAGFDFQGISDGGYFTIYKKRSI